MALTREEEAFYNNFKELLKREGIDAEHSYRLSEIVAIEDYIDDRERLQQNIVEPAMFERNNDPSIGRFGGNTLIEPARLKDSLKAFNNSSEVDKLPPEEQKLLIDDAKIMKQWIADDMKNPFDPTHEPSESLIKNLYRAYKENRLGLSNALYLNKGLNDEPKSMCFIYEAKDGSMKISAPSVEIENRYPFTFLELSDKRAFYETAKADEGCNKMLTEKFGEGVVESLAPYYVMDEEIPERPGFFTKVLANWFGHQASKEKVEAFDRYDAAVRRYNEIVEAIAKEAFPDAKKPLEMFGRYDQTQGTDLLNNMFEKQAILMADHEIKDKEEIQERLNQLTKDRSDVEKDLVKFALESQHDVRFPKVVRDFLRDVPDVYKELVNCDDMDMYANGDNKQFFLKTPEAVNNQKVLAKFAVYKMIVDDLKAGKLDSDLIQAVKAGEGEKLVEAFRVSSTFQQSLTNEAELKNILTAPAEETKGHFSAFQTYIKMNMGELYKHNLADANKRMEDARKAEPDRLLEREQAERAANEAERESNEAREASEAAKAARNQKRDSILNTKKTSFTDRQLEELAEVYKADYNESPTVDSFARWVVTVSAIKHQAENKANGKGNISKNSINRSINDCIEMINQLSEFKEQLESGKFNTLELADLEFAIAKGDVKEAAPKQEAVDNKKLQEPVQPKIDEPVPMK